MRATSFTKPPSAPKLTKEERKQQARQERTLKKEVTADLHLAYLRDKLIYYVQQLLMFNQFDFESNAVEREEYQAAVSIINLEQFEEVIEERVSLALCSNLQCKNTVDGKIVERFTKRKMQIDRNGIEKIKQYRIFCDKSKTSDHSECEQKFIKLRFQVMNENDHGPYSTKFGQVVTFLEKYSHQSVEESTCNSLDELDGCIIDKEKIRQTVQKFREEQAKVVAPIKERVTETTSISLEQELKVKSNTIEESKQQDSMNKYQKLEEESRAKSGFKMNVVSSRRNATVDQQTVIQETKQVSIEEDSKVEEIKETSDLKQEVKPKKKSVKFDAKVENDENQKEQDEFDNQVNTDHQTPSDQLNQSQVSDSSTGGFGALEFDDLEKELENYRLNEMNSFQKIYDLFIGLLNDNLFYYISGKKSYEDCDNYLKSATRDFFMRQLKINLDNPFFASSKTHVKKIVRECVDFEVSRLAYLMDISSLATSFDKDEWVSITRIYLSLASKKLQNHKNQDEKSIETQQWIGSEVQLSEEEQVIIDMFC
eukprot:403346997